MRVWMYVRVCTLNICVVDPNRFRQMENGHSNKWMYIRKKTKRKKKHRRSDRLNCGFDVQSVWVDFLLRFWVRTVHPLVKWNALRPNGHSAFWDFPRLGLAINKALTMAASLYGFIAFASALIPSPVRMPFGTPLRTWDLVRFHSHAHSSTPQTLLRIGSFFFSFLLP